MGMGMGDQQLTATEERYDDDEFDDAQEYNDPDHDHDQEPDQYQEQYQEFEGADPSAAAAGSSTADAR
jgi:hypothetical protein